MPIYSYPGGKNIYVPQLPQNTIFKWVDPYGGNTVGGPLNWGAVAPNGVIGHGGIYTNTNGIPLVEYHYPGGLFDNN